MKKYCYKVYSKDGKFRFKVIAERMHIDTRSGQTIITTGHNNTNNAHTIAAILPNDLAVNREEITNFFVRFYNSVFGVPHTNVCHEGY